MNSYGTHTKYTHGPTSMRETDAPGAGVLNHQIWKLTSECSNIYISFELTRVRRGAITIPTHTYFITKHNVRFCG